MYFSATIFAMVGFHSPIGTSLTIALTNFIFTLVAFTFIDVIGRRSILLRSIPFMVLGLGLCGIAFSSMKFVAHIDIDTLAVKNTDAISPILLVVSMIIYVAAYAVGLGCVPWQQSELFPLRVRSLGSGIATSVNWSSNAVIGITFLPMMRFLGPSLTFLIYALVCVVGWFLIFQIYPETAGLEIEDINLLLRDGWNVQNSIKDFRRRRAARFADVLTEPE
jgi:SP family myo-inositol transporter-like MFS transporter 13